MMVYCVRSHLCSFRASSLNTSSILSSTQHIVGRRSGNFSRNAILCAHTPKLQWRVTYRTHNTHDSSNLGSSDKLPQTPGASNGQLWNCTTLSLSFSLDCSLTFPEPTPPRLFCSLFGLPLTLFLGVWLHTFHMARFSLPQIFHQAKISH